MKNIIQQRNRDLCEAARLLADDGALTLDEIAEKLEQMQAPRFYVSRDYAYTSILRLRKGHMDGCHGDAYEKWKAFDAEVRSYMARHRFVSLIEAVDYVANEVPAPRFYLKKATLVRMLQYMNRRSRIAFRRDLLGVNRNGRKFIRHSPVASRRVYISSVSKVG